MKIISKEPFQIYGDIDILLKMRLFDFDQKTFEELFNKELHQYFPIENGFLKKEE